MNVFFSSFSFNFKISLPFFSKENKKEKDAKKQGGKKGEATGTEGFDSDSSELTDLEGS